MTKINALREMIISRNEGREAVIITIEEARQKELNRIYDVLRTTDIRTQDYSVAAQAARDLGAKPVDIAREVIPFYDRKLDSLYGMPIRRFGINE